jgi:hypothetical protein
MPLDLYDRVRTVLEANWRDNDWFYCDSAVIGHYAMKAAICERFRPRRILEIGSRCGYSLLAFREVAPRASFLCIDGAMDDDSLDCLAHCKKIIDKHDVEADLIVVDSHAVRSLPRADFAHVDGDHSYEGALADLRLVAHVHAQGRHEGLRQADRVRQVAGAVLDGHDARAVAPQRSLKSSSLQTTDRPSNANTPSVNSTGIPSNSNLISSMCQSRATRI